VRVRASEGVTPGKFMKTQMLNPAFWWLLAVKFLAFWKLRPRSWGTNTLLVPNLKIGDQSSPILYGCCAYVHVYYSSAYNVFVEFIWSDTRKCTAVVIGTFIDICYTCHIYYAYNGTYRLTDYQHRADRETRIEAMLFRWRHQLPVH